MISDGDLIANQITKGIPEPLGVDKYSGRHYGNKEFLLNCINYLLDDSGLIQIRSKNIELKTLNKELSYKNRNYYQFLNNIVSVASIGSFWIYIQHDTQKIIRIRIS